jgi:ribosomal protein S18 acetylase RimI-like enzyme
VARNVSEPGAWHNTTRYRNHFTRRNSREAIARREKRFSDQTEDDVTLVAKDGNKVVGICRVQRLETHNEQRAFYVLPEYQRRGVGTLLWGEAWKYLNPAKETIAKVVTYNTKAVRFYEKLGFRASGEKGESEFFLAKSGAKLPTATMVKNAFQ